MQTDLKNQDMLIHTSKHKNNLIGRLDCVCVCVDLSSGQGGPFPILRLTKACWTCPPPKNLITVIKARLRPTQCWSIANHGTHWCVAWSAVESLPPKVFSNFPGYYCATRLPKSLNSHESLSRVYSPSIASLISRATGRLGMCHSPNFISPFRNLSCLLTMCHLLPVIGRVSGGYWWLTNWASEAQSWVSFPARVGWFFAYDWDADLFCCVVPGIYAQVYPDWTCGVPTPDYGF